MRAKTEEMGLFKASPLFFFSIMLHILALEVLAWFLIYTCGTSWITLLGASILLVTAQVLPLHRCHKSNDNDVKVMFQVI